METHQDLELIINPYPFFSKKMQQKIDELPENLVEIEEDELLMIYTPNMNDQLLRQSLWQEYFRCVSNPKNKFMMARIYKGIVGPDVFFNKIMNRPERLAYILLPPAGYKIMMANLMDLTMKRFYEILSMPIDINNVNPAVLNAVVKIGSLVKDSLYGAAVQRNVNINTDIANYSNINVEDVDKKILEVKEKLEEKPGISKSESK